MKVPPLTTVVSSNLQSVGHSSAGLFVRFKSGGTYVYPDAPKSVYDALVQAESPGREFQNRVKGVFRHEAADE